MRPDSVSSPRERWATARRVKASAPYFSCRLSSSRQKFDLSLKCIIHRKRCLGLPIDKEDSLFTSTAAVSTGKRHDRSDQPDKAPVLAACTLTIYPDRQRPDPRYEASPHHEHCPERQMRPQAFWAIRLRKVPYRKKDLPAFCSSARFCLSCFNPAITAVSMRNFRFGISSPLAQHTLFMVRFSLNDPVTPVDLPRKNDPHELMWNVIFEKLSL